MPYTMEDFQDKVRKDALEMVIQDETLSNEFLKKLSPAERLKGLPADKVFAHFSLDERLKGLPLDERMKGLPLDVIQEYLSKHQKK